MEAAKIAAFRTALAKDTGFSGTGGRISTSSDINCETTIGTSSLGATSSAGVATAENVCFHVSFAHLTDSVQEHDQEKLKKLKADLSQVLKEMCNTTLEVHFPQYGSFARKGVYAAIEGSGRGAAAAAAALAASAAIESTGATNI